MSQPRAHSSRVNDEFEQLFVNLKQEIIEYHTLVQSVQAFKQYIENGVKEGIFDREDMDWIESDLKELLIAKEKKEHELRQKEDLYKNSVLKLEDILARRKDAIEDAEKNTHALSLRPELLKHFAKKRAQLMLMVDKGKQDLQLR
jgi:flavin-dependent dehydrogenase